MADQKHHPETDATPPEDTGQPAGPDEAQAAPEAAGEGGADDATAAAERIAALEAEVSRIKDDHLRALAEIENIRRRAARDRADAAKYAVTAFARDVLAVADNLQRALAAVEPSARGADPALDGLIVGVEMTEKELLSVFQRHGIVPIAAQGERFDPNVHDAMFEVPDESVPNGTVVQVVQTGYVIGERTLRAAMVVVSAGPADGEWGVRDVPGTDRTCCADRNLCQGAYFFRGHAFE